MSDYPMLISNKLHSFRNFCTQTSKMSIFDAISHKLRVSFWKKAKKVLLLARFTTNTLWGNTGNLSLKQRKNRTEWKKYLSTLSVLERQ